LTTESLQEFTGGTTDPRALGIDPNRTDVGPLLAALSSPGGLRITADLLRDYPGLGKRLSYFLGDQGRTTRVVVAFDSSPYAASVLSTTREMDSVAATALAESDLGGARVAVGGPSAYFSDIQTLANADVRTVGALVLGIILAVLAALVRSVIAPLYLLASAALSMLAALGITTLVFQGILGHAGVAFYLPIFLFVMLIALGSDYNIFIVGRIREELDAGHTVREATVKALVSTGPTITAAGFVLAGTFAALLITPLPSIRQIGFGVAVGILIDTFVVRTLVVPAATILLGRYAFWPSTGRAPAARPRIAVASAVASFLALAVALPGLAFAARDRLAIVEVPAQATAPANAASATVAAPTAPPAKTSQPAAPAPVAEAEPSPSLSPRNARTQQPKRSKKASTPPMAPPMTPASDALSVAAPTEGRWTYQVKGTRTVGAAGTAQPFAEDADSIVTRTGGTATAPEFRVTTKTSFASAEEQRRYHRSSVDALSQRVSALGMAYGGTFDTPQQLVRTPLRVGDSWTSQWRAEDTRGTTTSTVTGTRTVSVAGSRLLCYIIERTTTMKGDLTGTQSQRTCWAPLTGMPAVDEQQVRGTYQGVQFEAEVSMILRATPPNSATQASDPGHTSDHARSQAWPVGGPAALTHTPGARLRLPDGPRVSMHVRGGLHG
ncbi:MMPL family transporter, partial [Sporichthya polymorpha]|uniref:MMPL family transporter n=1 Tax=Sporichthya polymorpha TaxID=35751 RepID=UPI0004915066